MIHRSGIVHALALAMTFCITATPVVAAERPNILFIFTDDHASHAIGAYGGWLASHAPTPNLDRLAREGMLFRNCFVTNSICGPSRAVILTGKHSHLNGFPDNRGSTVFDGSQVTFPKLLRNAGYATAMIGKWHLRSDPTGFDHWEVLNDQGTYYNPQLLSAKGKRVVEGYTTDIITDLALEWLDKNRDKSKPFMLMYQHKAPHREWSPGPDHLDMFDGVTLPEAPTLFDDYKGRASPASDTEMTIAEHMIDGYDLKIDWAPPNLTPAQRERFLAAYRDENEALKKANLQGKDLVRWKYQRYVKDYLRCIASVDDNVGRVLKYLQETGLDKNTIVIYSSDQGFYLGDHGWYDKRWMYEESMRMPLIVRWPGVVKAGSEDKHLVQNLDFAQTFLDIAGVKADPAMQGRSIVPLLKGQAPADWRTSIYYHYYEYPRPHRVQKHYGVRTDRYKLIYYYPVDEWELFDLHKDPDELNSVYGHPAYAEIVLELKKELKRLQDHYGDVNPHQDPPSPQETKAREAMKREPVTEQVRLAEPKGALPTIGIVGKPITAGALVTPAGEDGVIIAQGGEALGYSLYLDDGRPTFVMRRDGELFKAQSRAAVPVNRAVHLVGVLDAELKLHVYVNGERAATADGAVIARQPSDGLSIGADTGSPVGEYSAPNKLSGELRDIRIYTGVLGDKAIRQWAGKQE